MEKLNHPEKKLKFIHVAGTNGKGSVVEMLSSILIDAGYKVGKFMSPMILTHHERFIINKSGTFEKHKKIQVVYYYKLKIKNGSIVKSECPDFVIKRKEPNSY